MNTPLTKAFITVFFGLFPDEDPLIKPGAVKQKDEPTWILGRRASRVVLNNFLLALDFVLKQSVAAKLPDKPLFCTEAFYTMRKRTIVASGITRSEEALIAEIEKIRQASVHNKEAQMTPEARHAALRAGVTALMENVRKTEIIEQKLVNQTAQYNNLDVLAPADSDMQTLARFGDVVLKNLTRMESITDKKFIEKTDGPYPYPYGDFYSYDFLDDLKKEANKLCPEPPSRCLVM